VTKKGAARGKARAPRKSTKKKKLGAPGRRNLGLSAQPANDSGPTSEKNGPRRAQEPWGKEKNLQKRKMCLARAAGAVKVPNASVKNTYAITPASS